MISAVRRPGSRLRRRLTPATTATAENAEERDQWQQVSPNTIAWREMNQKWMSGNATASVHRTRPGPFTARAAEDNAAEDCDHPRPPEGDPQIFR